MNPEMHTTLLNMINLKLMEPILKALRGCSNAIHRRVCGFNKQGACLNHDVGEFVKQREII